MSNRMPTLRAALVRTVLWPALVLILASAALDYKHASDVARLAQDGMIFKTAVALATRLSPDEEDESSADLAEHLSLEDIAMIKTDPGDEIRFLVLNSKGAVLVGDSELQIFLPLLVHGEVEKPSYSDQTLQGEEIRLVDFSHTSRGETQRVLVTETSHKRLATARTLALNTVWPNVLLLLAVMALIHMGTRKALVPLEKLSQSIDQRESEDMTPLPLPQVPGEIQSLVGAINRLLVRVEAASTEQQLFLSSAAHQLRTPLAGMHMQIELALEDAPPPVRQRLTRVLGGMNDLIQCTQQMLILARSSALTNSVHDFVDMDLAELLEDAASTWLDAALSHSVELVFEIHPTRCTGSRWMLQQLLNNLIDNGIKHSPQGGHVTLSCGMDPDGRAYVQVQDQGPGISPQDQAHVFEPFFRNREQTVPGSGLGLTIVKEVADRHHALVQFMDTQIAAGLSVRVTFPRFKPLH